MREQDNPLVSVVIPNWNGLAHFPECIQALRDQTYPNFEIIVSDNDSADGSVEWLQEHAREVAIIRRPNNDGFAAAVNEGIRSAAGDYIYLLNNDTHAEPNCIAELVAALQGSNYDFAASLMVFYDDPSLVNTAGDIFSIPQLLGVQRGALLPADQFQQPVRVLGASGGAVMYRRGFFEVVGPYDEDFFVLHEDTDINLRALIAGQQCVYVPSSVVRHKVGSSVGRKPNALIQRASLRNQYVVLGKDLPDILLPAIAGIWAWYTFRDVLPLRPDKWHLIPLRWSEFRARFAVQREGYSLGRSKRREVWARKTVSTREILQWLRRGTGPV